MTERMIVRKECTSGGEVRIGNVTLKQLRKMCRGDDGKFETKHSIRIANDFHQEMIDFLTDEEKI